MDDALLALLGVGLLALWSLLLFGTSMAGSTRRPPYRPHFGAHPPTPREEKAMELLGRAVEMRRKAAAATPPAAATAARTEPPPTTES